MNKYLSVEEIEARCSRLRLMMEEAGIEALVATTNANVYYLSGRVFSGCVYLPADGRPLFFVQRPVGIEGDNVIYIKKPELIPDALRSAGIEPVRRIALELDRMPWSDVERYRKALGEEDVANASPLLAAARAVKTPYEIGLMRESGQRHCASYRRIPGLFHEGMTDVELQIEIERVLRLDGCLGIFRIGGQSMELFMGNLLVGDNADEPGPYDFAMGGGGLNSSLPVGCNGTIIRPGHTVMVDMNGNFTGYMTDMTRTFYVGSLDSHAAKCHRLSIEIHHALQTFIKPGVSAKDAYNLAAEMVTKSGEQDYFMGHRQQAGFIGHGVGIEVNEWPVLAPRSRHAFEEGNVIALEPKFVIPCVGAVGVESTYAVTSAGLENLTPFPEDLTELIP